MMALVQSALLRLFAAVFDLISTRKMDSQSVVQLLCCRTDVKGEEFINSTNS